MENENSKLGAIRQLIEAAEDTLIRAKALLDDAPSAQYSEGSDVADKARAIGRVSLSEGAKIVEGIFDGQNMIGPDGKQYSVPANYASKSKLVEGDQLKLTIMPDGSFVYKQIGPVERQRLIGTLIKDEATGDFAVMSADRMYKILLASITYFKGELGDEVVVLIPKDNRSQWAAVENVIKKGVSLDLANGVMHQGDSAEDDMTKNSSEPDDLHISA